MGPTHPTRLRIGAFCVDASTDEVSRDGVSSKLEPRAMRLLAHLARRAGEVVSVDDLLNTVWGDVVVTPDSVYQAIAMLRRIFDDDPKAPRYIVNVPRRGYRLVAPVSSWAEPAASDSAAGEEPKVAVAAAIANSLHRTQSGQRRYPLAIAGIVLAAIVAMGLIYQLRSGRPHTGSPVEPPASGVATIAVLPFVDMSEKKDQEYFSDGISEELIDLLARNPALRVSSRTSSFYFKGKPQDIAAIARQLHVANVLEGSVRKAGNTLRVTVQLIRADNGFHLWSQAYDRELTDVLKMQDDIAVAVIGSLLPKLAAAAASSPPRGAVVGEAYEQWLLAKFIITSHPQDGGIQRAIAALENAIQRDPNFPPAYSALGFMKCMVAADAGESHVIDGSRQLFDKALALSPGLPDVYGARSQCRLFSLDLPGALADAERAVAAAPGDARWRVALAYALASNGRYPEAIAAAKVGSEIDPLQTYAWTALGEFYTMIEDRPAARGALERALAINPGEVESLFAKGILDLLDGRADRALETFTNIRSASYRNTGIALAQYSLHHARESDEALADLTAGAPKTSAYQIAQVHAWRGEHDEALKWLQQSLGRGDPGLSYLAFDPVFIGLQSDARYRQFLQTLHLPP